MDWLPLGLVLLTIIGNIRAQQGYSYPKPETSFPETGNASPGTQSQLSGGYQRPFETQQPSGGYPSATQPQNGVQRPFGTQAPTGYPDASRPATQPLGTQQPSYTQPEGSAGQQRPFGTQKPSTGFSRNQIPEGGKPVDTQRPGYQTSGLTGQQGTVQQPSYPGTGRLDQQGSPGVLSSSTGQRAGGGRSFDFERRGTQPISDRPIGQQGQSTAFGGNQQLDGSRYPSQNLNGGLGDRQQGYTYNAPQKPFGGAGQTGPTASGADFSTGNRPGQSNLGSSGFGQTPGSSSVSERPLGDTRFPITSQFPSGEQIPASLPFPSSSGSPGTQQQTLSGVRQSYPERKEQQYASGGVQNQFSSNEQQQPGRSGKQLPIGQNGYSASAGTTGSQFPSPGVTQPFGSLSGQISSKRPAPFPSTGSQIPSDESTADSSLFGKQGEAGRTTDLQFPSRGTQTPAQGQANGYATPGSPDLKSNVIPDVGRPTRPKLPVGIPENERRPLSSYLPPGQGTGGLPLSEASRPQYPSTGFTSPGSQSSPGSGVPSGLGNQPTGSQNGAFGASTRKEPFGGPQFASGSTGRGSGFQNGDFREQPSGSQFPSGPIRSQNGYDAAVPSIGRGSGSQFPSGTVAQPTGSQNGFGTSTGGQPTGSQLSPGSVRTQNGYDASVSSFGRGSGSQFPSGTVTQPTASQNGFGTSTGGQPTGSQISSGSVRTQNGYDAPVSSFGRGSGSQYPSGIANQPVQSQSGVDTSTRGQPSGSQYPIPSQNGYNTAVPGTSTGGVSSSGQPASTQFTPGGGQLQANLQESDRYPTNGKPSTSPQITRPESSGRSLDLFPRPIGGQTFPGSQQGSRDFIPSQQGPSEGDYNEEDEGDYSAIPGQPGRDYPILSEVPETTFSCDAQEYRGYYADIETRCQIFHICANNKTYDFLCPNGTIFHQEYLVCVWWNQFDCNSAPSLYRVNEGIYDYTIFGAQQTGGIPISGDYPDTPQGSTGFAGQSQGGEGRVTGGERPGYQAGGFDKYPTRLPQTPDLEEQGGFVSVQRPGSGFQRPGVSSTEYPRGSGQTGTQQGTTNYQRPGGYPDRRPQGTSGTVQSAVPGREGQRFGGRALSPTGTSSAGYPIGESRLPGEYPRGGTGYPAGRPQSGTQSPGEYPSRDSEGASRPSVPAYPSRTAEAGRESQSTGYPSGEVGRPSLPSGVQKANGVPQGVGGYQQGSGSFPGGIQKAEYGAPVGLGYQSQGPVSPQQSTGFATGTSSKPDFPTRAQTSAPSGPAGSSTREYLPPV